MAHPAVQVVDLEEEEEGFFYDTLGDLEPEVEAAGEVEAEAAEEEAVVAEEEVAAEEEAQPELAEGDIYVVDEGEEGAVVAEEEAVEGAVGEEEVPAEEEVAAETEELAGEEAAPEPMEEPPVDAEGAVVEVVEDDEETGTLLGLAVAESFSMDLDEQAGEDGIAAEEDTLMEESVDVVVLDEDEQVVPAEAGADGAEDPFEVDVEGVPAEEAVDANVGLDQVPDEDLDAELTAIDVPQGESEEPPEKRQKMSDALFDLSQPISNDLFGEDEEDAPKPTFTAPSAKWSGVPKKAAPPPPARKALPKVMPKGSMAAGHFQPSAKAKIVPTAVWKPAGPPAKAGSVSTVKLDPHNGYVFHCSNQTAYEVTRNRVFGCPDRDMNNLQTYIKQNTQLFLLNMDTLKMLGPFSANGKPGWNLVKGAFGGRFNAQVKILPSPELKEAQVEKKIPSGFKNAEGMLLIDESMSKGDLAPINVLQAWGVVAGGAAPSSAPNRVVAPKKGWGGGPQPPPFAPPATVALSQGGPRTDRFIAGVDKEGRQYNLTTVVVNFANVGASYASKVLKKDNKKGDRLFDWEGVRRCLRCLTKEFNLSVVGCIFENYWGPDNSPNQVPMPADIRGMCSSVQETPMITGKNHKSADDEMTIKCAYRRNCRFLDNDNYRDWLREMRDNRIRDWLENSQEMLQMRYFFDSELGSFDTLDGNVPVGLLAEASKAKGYMYNRAGMGASGYR